MSDYYGGFRSVNDYDPLRPWRLRALLPDGKTGLVQQGYLRFSTKEEAEVTRVRWTENYPGVKFESVWLGPDGFAQLEQPEIKTI